MQALADLHGAGSAGGGGLPAAALPLGRRRQPLCWAGWSNMQFVRREAGYYHLHQVDPDYALSRLPAGDPADRDADPAPFTQQALRHRGAAYFEQTRTPRENWKTLDDLAPQLAEFELRYQGQDYDTAAQVLVGIGSEFLSRWGHYRLTAEPLQGLQGSTSSTQTPKRCPARASSASCSGKLGQFRRAIDALRARHGARAARPSTSSGEGQPSWTTSATATPGMGQIHARRSAVYELSPDRSTCAEIGVPLRRAGHHVGSSLADVHPPAFAERGTGRRSTVGRPSTWRMRSVSAGQSTASRGLARSNARRRLLAASRPPPPAAAAAPAGQGRDSLLPASPR